MRCPCCDKQENNRGAWSKEEDQKLISYIRAHGEVSWRSLPKAAGLLRCGKSCRLRWINYLRPDVKRGNFKEDEEDLIIKLHALLGNRWSLIAGRLPGRTDNEVKNYWNSHLRKRLKSMGVDPDNHHLAKGSVALRRRAERSWASTIGEAAVSRHGGSGHSCGYLPCGGLCSSGSTVLKCMDTAEEMNSNCSDGMIELPDLNLDLAISAVPCKKSKNGGGEIIAGQAACGEVAAGDSRRSPSTTLLLFR